ncbi:MAG: hypothetical protein HXS54_06345 [Theionarchaea archaeon]|nr:hypothetical protein [Theionarchaea archaeon]DBA34880.1 TPA_asm: hypothetical protein vir521_00086 [Caudoviricetes sp. vir521]
MTFEIFFDCEVLTQKRKNKFQMSICGWYDTYMDQFDVTEGDILGDFIEIASDASLIVCFNGLRFDYDLFKTAGYPAQIAKEKTFDVYFKLTQLVYGGLPPKRNRKQRAKSEWPYDEQGSGGLDLDSLGKVNLGYGKIPLTVSPAKLWEAGEYDLVEAYNRRDVQLTRDLLWMAQNYEYLEYENERGVIEKIDCSDWNETIDAIQSRELWGW